MMQCESIRLCFIAGQPGCALGEDMLEMMYLIKSDASVKVLHGMLS